jgi:threonine dehydrogenase-like Zn-dependent dehydrogenase
MKAAVKVGKERFDVVEVDTPAVRDGEVLVRVHYCLICAWCFGEWLRDGTDNRLGPGTTGHEVSGVVEETGPGATAFRAGDRVLVYDTAHCGECEECRAGRETFCKSAASLHQGFAEYVKVPERNLFPAPAGMDLKSAAMVTDMVGTSMRAIRRAFEVPLARRVCTVWGLGPVGLVALQCLKATDGVEKVIGLDPLANRREMALRLGADQALDPTSEESLNAVRAENGDRGCDYAFNCGIRDEDALQQVLTTVRRDGYLMNVTGRARSWGQCEKRIDGTFYFWRNEFQENAGLVTSGRVRVAPVISHEFPLAEINEAMALRAKRPGECLKVAVRCN